MKWYKQHDTMDCGPTCLKMIAKFYNNKIPQEYISECITNNKTGISLYEISSAAINIGFKTEAVNTTIDALLKYSNTPVILHWNENHFVVLYKIKKNTYHIADPGKGLLKYKKKEFESNWLNKYTKTGIALILEPTSKLLNFSYAKVQNKKYPFIKKLLSQKKKYVIIFLCLITSSYLLYLLPIITKNIVDSGIKKNDLHLITLLLLSQLFIFIGKTLLDFIRNWTILNLSKFINISIFTEFLRKLLNLPLTFFERKNTGDILQRMNDHNRIETFITNSTINTLFSIFSLLTLSVVLFKLNYNIFLIFLAFSALHATWITLSLKPRKLIDYKMFYLASIEQNKKLELIQGAQEIKLYNIGESILKSWADLLTEKFKLIKSSFLINQRQLLGSLFFNEGKNILIIYISAGSVISGEMTYGAMLAIQFTVGQLNSPIEQLLNFVQNFQGASISMNRLNEVYNLKNEEYLESNLLNHLPIRFQKSITGGFKSAKFENENSVITETSEIKEFTTEEHIYNSRPIEDVAIHLQNVHFNYDSSKDNTILKNISISIPKGKTTAIVGTSGSGKTTLLKILLRIYNPTEGEILIDNMPLNKISHSFWRDQCGSVLQDSFIFSDTILRNIVLGNERIDDRKVDQAIRIANLSDMLKNFPLGVNTKIGVEGTGLSMGQKQRILIARAVYRDPDFLFFDEATNSLDSTNETEILMQLQDFYKKRTVIIVAHRLNTVRNADQIIVLNSGVVTEIGTHHDLVKLNGEYFKLFKNQL